MEKFPLARAGWPYVLGGLVLALVASALKVWWLAVPLWIIFLLMLNFFRDPARTSDAGPGAVLSPADGKVVVAETSCHAGLPGGDCLMVSIFMNIFDVHVNRAPLAGRVMKVVHHPGGYLPADRPQAATTNERVEMTLTAPGGPTIVVAQVAGLVARRIDCWVAGGIALARGQRYGMIRFGSRLDLYLPPGARLQVAPGQRVKAGQTVIAEV
jgi:phosphatidylserine decarboxylase